MKPEQLSFLRWVVKPPSEEIFEAFLKNTSAIKVIQCMESQLKDAWNCFLRERKKMGEVQKYVMPELTEIPAKSRQTPPTHSTAIPQNDSKSPSNSASRQSPLAPVKVEGGTAAEELLTHSSVAALLPVARRDSASAQPEKKMDSSTPAAPPPAAPPPRQSLRLSIKNAKQGEAFEDVIKIEPANSRVELAEVKFPDGMGLRTDNAHWRITGTPALSGEFDLDVRYRHTDDATPAVRSASLNLIVNPDPKSLWQDLPSDRNEPFWKEDNAHRQVSSSHARILAARRRGRSHAHKGTCCDDDFVIHTDPSNDWHLAIVADGAGSAKFSRRGSHLATTTAADFLWNAFSGEDGASLAKAMEDYARLCGSGKTHDDNSVEAQTLRNRLYTTIGHAAHAAVKALNAEAARRSDVIKDVKELATTLLIGVARKIGTRWVCAAYWVGDGAVGVYRRNKDVVLLGDPDSGEYSGQTRFLTAQVVGQEELLRRLRFTCVEDMTGMVLMTDGVSDPKFSSETQMGKLTEWDDLWSDMNDAVHLDKTDAELETRLLDWLNFWTPGEYDDRTIAIIY